MACNRNCIEIDHYRVVQSNVVHGSRAYVQNVRANDQPLAETPMALIWHHHPNSRIKAAAKRLQLKMPSTINTKHWPEIHKDKMYLPALAR